jgi:PAS domain S-box-containing protein
MNAPFSNCLLKGTDHVFELVNNTSSKLMPHHVIGKKFKDAFPEFEQQGLVNVLDNVYLKGEDFEAKELLVKMDQNKDGALVDKYLNMQLTPYRDAAGNVEGVYYFGVHVTEQVLARNKLEESFEKLKSAESLQSSILNSLPAQVALLDHEGKIVAVNQAWKDFGQVNNLNSKNHSVGDNYIKVSGKAIGPDKKSGKEIAKGIVDVINGNNSEFSLEYRCDSAEEKRWFIVRVSPAHSQKDRGAVVMHTNITERKLAEEKIRKSEANLSALIENTDAFVYSLDTNFCYVTFNKRLSRSIRASAGLDIKIGDDVFAFLKNSDPDAAQMWKNRYTEALSGKFLQFEMDYSQAGIPRFFNFFISPIKEGGNVIGLSCFARDITEKKIAENELKRLHKRLLLATRSANMGIWDWDITNDHLSWDDGMFKLYEIEGMKFRSAYDAWLQRLHPEDKEKVNEDIQAAIAGKKEYDTEFRIICNNSAIRYIKATGLVERDAAGNAVRMIGANWDITASKLAEMEVIELNENLEKRILERTSELAEANKALEAFSYSVSHDLRSPVRSIVGFTQIIKDEFENSFGPELKELFGYIHNSGKRMDTIITDLLNLAKLDKAPLNITSINLNDLVSKVWMQLRSAAVHEVEFVVDTFPQVRGDASTIEQVLINMLGNAIKYSSKKKNPLITMGYEEKEDVIVFYISDNGAGFDMKDYGRLFGAFQRLHGDSEFEGTGIGLLLVKRIIEKHGGAIWAEGKIEEGATFYFSLPAEKTRV